MPASPYPAAAPAIPPWTWLRLEAVTKVFRDTRGGEYTAARDISIAIDRGDFYCLLGPSGCGKTTLLNLIAGFEQVTAGAIAFAGEGHGKPWRQTIQGPGVERAMIFQDVGEALFPWLNVEENILFGPRMAGVRRDDCLAKLDLYLRMVGLREDAHKFPFELSGGMKQRVQIARALIMEPEVLLMDEPFAALDAITKRLLQQELSRIWQETQRTIVYITHDLIEALLLGTRVAVMTAGPAATIKCEFRVDLPRPRIATAPDFVEFTRRLETLLHEEVYAARKAMGEAT
jgi:NitT/TauT family transport system ATP-binding protein